MARVIYSWLLITLIYFSFHHSLIHQLEQPILIYPEADNTYWLLHMLNLPQLILQSKTVSLIFDIVLISSTALFILFPEATIFSLLSLVCFWLFEIMYSSSAGHHYHHAAYLIVPIPFLFRDRIKFTLSWWLVRYWII